MMLHEVAKALRLWEARFTSCDALMEGPRYSVRNKHEAARFIKDLISRLEKEDPFGTIQMPTSVEGLPEPEGSL